MFDDLTIILPFRNRLDKLKNLKYSLNFYKKFGVEHAIVVEQDIKQTISDSLFVYNPGLFNRSWAFNVGLRYSKSKIVFSDIDVYIDHDVFVKSYELLNDGDFVKPYNRFINLNEEISEKIRNNYFMKPNEDNIVYPNIGAGMLFANKESVLRIGGWPEEFEGWGGEDDVMSLKIAKLCRTFVLERDLYHLHHLRSVDVSTHTHSNYEKNRKLALEIIPAMSQEEFIKYVNVSKTVNVGAENKYGDLQ